MNDADDKLDDYEDIVLPMEFNEIVDFNIWYYIGAIGLVVICVVSSLIILIKWLS